MSALLVDELVVSSAAVLRQGSGSTTSARVSVVSEQRRHLGVIRELRSGWAGVSPQVRALPLAPAGPVPIPSASWRLTDRGIAVVMALFVGLFLTGVVVLVASFLSISDAPVVAPVAAVAAFQAGR